MSEATRHGLPAVLFLSVYALGAQPVAGPPYTLVAEVSLQNTARAPWVQDRWVVFSYRPRARVRYVGIRFLHEDYAVLHPLDLNEVDTFVLVYEPPAGLASLTYRMSVDGMWMRDPANPDYTTDIFGTPYSRVDLSAIAKPQSSGPTVGPDGRVRFALAASPDRLVTLAGSFNHWDPFVHVMEQVSSGLYEITLRLPPGEHHYYFLENGNKRLDPANLQVVRTQDNELVNTVVVQ